jgi:HD-GYP domain-containing protein (c-di-GMP phosphodiesterase class II)
MRFATRTFLWSFLPFALLLGGSFVAIHWLVESTVRGGLRNSLRDAHQAMSEVRKNSEMQNNRFLQIVGQNPALKNGVQLLLANPQSREAQQTVVEQLQEICQELHFDYLLVSNSDGKPLAGVLRIDEALLPMDIARMNPAAAGFYNFGSRTFQVTSIPVDQGDERLAMLSVGQQFSLGAFTATAVLLHDGKVVRSTIPDAAAREIEAALSGANGGDEVRLHGVTYLTLPSDAIDFGGGYVLRTMQNVDTANGQVQGMLTKVFLATGVAAIFFALVITVLSSRSIVRPIAGVVETLKESEHTGLLPKFEPGHTGILEIRELTTSFNRAGLAIREARGKLEAAYVEFVGSLAGALDARDPYTAGHSRRVSEYACSIAQALNLSETQREEIRIAALLHDFGKVGIADSVLRKPGRLSAEEFALLKQHPTIGRRILEGVAGFQAYLPVVELHHENWDGTGYPLGLAGENVPLFARIVHVADAYDAMTSDRPYRRGFSHEAALAELLRFAGSQFDPSIVSIFTKLSFPEERPRPLLPGDDPHLGLHIV